MSDEILAQLKKASKSFEVYQVTTYQMYRERRAGGTQTVKVEILDAGPGSSARYHISATSDDGRSATGNPDARIEVAIAPVHWGDLDK